MTYSGGRDIPLALRAQAKLTLRRRRKARAKARDLGFRQWLDLHSSGPEWSWDWPHMKVVTSTMEEVAAGSLNRVMFFLPPRHGKSESVTVRFTAYSLATNPSHRFILAAYNVTLAKLFSRKVRKLVRGLPGIQLSQEQKAKDEWEVTQGGGVLAAGVGSGVTGRGANGVMIDDPVKNREEAHSQAFQDRAWGWWKTDIRTRLEPEAWVVLIMTRWAEDDLAGRILNSPGGHLWKVVRLPGLAESQEDRDHYWMEVGRPALVGQPDPIGREVGQALCPDRYDEEDFQEFKDDMGLLDFMSLIQQRPTAIQGDFFKREWLTIVPALSEEDLRKAKWVRYWDKAGTSGAGARTAGVLLAKVGKEFFIQDVVTGQWSAAEREAIILQTAQADRSQWGSGVTQWVEQEPGSGGKESAEATITRLAAVGITAKADKVTGDKLVRAGPVASMAMTGNVYLVEGPWNKEFIDILAAFPTGAIKDPVDGLSGAFNKLAISLPVFLGGRRKKKGTES